MGRPQRSDSPGVVQISVRLSDLERKQLVAVILDAEQQAGLAAGTVTPSAYVRSVLLRHLEEKTKASKGHGR